MDVLSAIRAYGGAGLGELPMVPVERPSALLKAKELQELPQSSQVSPASSFGGVLAQFVGEVNDRQVMAGEAARGLLGGGNVSLHQAMIAMEEASVSFQLMVEVRNKVMESYQELMRMQI